MSPNKVAAQIAHAVACLGHEEGCTIIVLEVSDRKFYELTELHDCYIQVDAGFTEVEAGTATAAAWYENEKEN